MSSTSVASSKKSTSRKAVHRKAPEESAGRGGNGMDREEMIAVAAYYRAEHRGFNGGDPMADWLAAEAEIDSLLNNSHELVVH